MATHLKADNPDIENGIFYPSSDGLPMSETDFHYHAIVLLGDALRDHFAHHDDVYVACDVNWYWEQGNPRVCRSPDALVVFGVAKHLRRTFRSWNEGGQIPRVCFEIASEGTWRANLGEVRDDYEAAGVREYFLFDPTREYLPEPLMGFRLRRGVYQPISAAPDGTLISKELGLKLLPEGLMLRLIDANTDARVLTKDERAEAERQQKEAERRRADVAQQQADAERQRADQLAVEVQRLQELLRQQNQNKNDTP